MSIRSSKPDRRKTYLLANWDTFNSTFRHQINFTNGKSIIGYSRRRGFTEQQDKIVLLEGVICRLYQNKYLSSNTESIHFYLNQPVTQDHELVLTLSPSDYSFGKVEKFYLSDRLNEFLKKFYKEIAKAPKDQIVQVNRLKNRPINKKEVELFSLEKKRFNDEKELLDFALKQTKEGYAPGLVSNFYLKYKEKYFVDTP